MKINKVKRVQVNSKKDFELEIKMSRTKCFIAQTYLERALAMKNKELIFLAVDLFTEAISIYPKCTEAYAGLAYIEYVWGNEENAYRIINQARKMDPVNIEISELLKKIEKELIRKQISKAKSNLKKKVESNMEKNNNSGKLNKFLGSSQKNNFLSSIGQLRNNRPITKNEAK